MKINKNNRNRNKKITLGCYEIFLIASPYACMQYIHFTKDNWCACLCLSQFTNAIKEANRKLMSLSPHNFNPKQLREIRAQHDEPFNGNSHADLIIISISFPLLFPCLFLPSFLLPFLSLTFPLVFFSSPLFFFHSFSFPFPPSLILPFLSFFLPSPPFFFPSFSYHSPLSFPPLLFFFPSLLSSSLPLLFFSFSPSFSYPPLSFKKGGRSHRYITRKGNSTRDSCH